MQVPWRFPGDSGTARQALGDDGKAQRFIKTVHGLGLRFIAEVKVARGEAAPSTVEHTATDPAQDAPVAGQGSRPSIAVLPFGLIGDPGRFAAIAEVLPHEPISELSRLRWLFVTARGSSFRLRKSDADIGEIGRLLGVRYCLTGTVEVSGRNLTVTEDLDAWSAYHVGLQHMYRFNRIDNAAANALFQQAISLDARFARAHAGLSFVHFQTAFLRHTDDLNGEIRLARSFAERGVELDPLYYAMLGTRAFTHMVLGEDVPAAHWAEQAAKSPGAHVLIAMIAAAAPDLAGDDQRAAAWAANVRERNATLTRNDFFRSFPMKSEATRQRVSCALARYGF